MTVVVKVPKPPPEAYNTDRPVADLQISQIERLQRVVREAIKTEGQAAEYIRALTRRVKATHAHIAPRSHKSAWKQSARSTGPKKRPRPGSSKNQRSATARGKKR